MSLDLLPPELIVQILGSLPVRDIRAFDLVSRYCHSVVCLNESAIYQTAAAFHGFIGQDRPSPPLISEVTTKPDTTGLLDGVTSWKEICRRCVLREHAWIGKHRNDHRETSQADLNLYLPNTSPGVHRFKVDEVERTVICSLTFEGGLFVMAIDSGKILWRLSSDRVAPHALVEYDQGFIAFTGYGSDVEVWRRSADCFDPERYLQCSPDPSQVQASPQPVPEFPPSFPPLYDGRPVSPDSPLGPSRGVYLPFALLVSPAPAELFRLVYPYLLVASDSTHQAFMWHIPTSALIEIIEIRPPLNRGASHLPLRLNHVDFNDFFIFVCWSFALVTYRREATSGKTSMTVLFDLQSIAAEPNRISFGGIPCHTFTGHLLSDHNRSNPSSVHPLPGPSGASSLTRLKHFLHSEVPTLDWFSRTYISSDGRDLVAVTGAGWLIYLPDFRITSSRQRIRPPFRIWFSRHQTRYIHSLAFDGTRILLAIDSEIISITVQDLLHPDELPHIPKIRHLAMLPRPKYDGADWKVSCLQVQSGSMWFACIRHQNGGLACVDLSAAAIGFKRGSLEGQMTTGQKWGVGLGDKYRPGSTDLLWASVPVCVLATALLVRPDWASALQDQLHPGILKLGTIITNIIGT